MSHRATNWAVEQRGIPPIAKVVLWHLADRHNPDNGCFPDQDTLAKSVEVSRASINRHLTELEKAGLIRREPRIDKTTGRQLSTRYRLGFEEGFEPLDIVVRVSGVDTENRVSENGESVSQDQPVPCLTAETPREPVIRTGKTNQEKNARARSDLTEGLAVVSQDSPDFKAITAYRKGKRPIVGKSGSTTVTSEELMLAREAYGLQAHGQAA